MVPNVCAWIVNFTQTQPSPLPTITDPDLYQKILTYLTYVNVTLEFPGTGSGEGEVFSMDPLK